ncbi:MAG: NPCBM/NEW2 domain-containing protein [Lentisphaeraceae bacterium]|nr:NPCBM/NEW2 domain-containing protein [Lentisphaeraceae bacterium]
MKILKFVLTAIFILCGFSTANAKTKIVLIAGADSHGPGDHEFRAGCNLFKKKLDEKMGDKLDVVVVEHDWPKNEDVFKNAAAVVFYSDGLGRHPLVKGKNRLEFIDELSSKGVGIAFMHFACDVPPGKQGDLFKKWVGGHYETRYSTNPHWVCDSILNKEHPVCNGVGKFSLEDEWYFNIRFTEDNKHKFVLKGIPDDKARSGKSSHPRGPYKHIVANSGREETLLWTLERPDGGRGFGFTGGHNHENWQNDELRKLILNAILWIAKIDLPENGIETSKVTDEELHYKTKNWLKEQKSGVNKKAKSTQQAKVIYRSPVLKKYESVDINVDIKGLKKLVLTVDGTGDISHDHANWINPQISGPKGTLSLLDLKWEKATTEWKSVQKGKNIEGKDVIFKDKKVTSVIGTHANSHIVYTLPDGYEKFTAIGALARSSGGGGSVEFIVNDKVYVAEEDKYLSANAFNADKDLEVTVWATSPMFYNPTNMDVDAKGRIWVAEGVNYRLFRKPVMDVKHPEGDRIMVLEDTDNDGKADKSHVFVQDKELVAPLGVAVIGNKVIVSQPPSLIMYTDVDGDAKFDPKVDKKENFLTGFSGSDHDHSLHSVTFGPDGEYYFNQGNAGYSEVKDNSGFTVRAGSSYRGGSPTVTSNRPGEVSDDGFIYVGGFACRVKPDGTGLTVIGHNFRNSYEQTVTSFGDVFQNDNDDPPACRTTWLMEYGNTGFASADGKRTWRADQRPGQSVPIAEWRQEDPGTIPAGDVYGGGAPTGICFYENGALGKDYRGLLLSCESVKSVVFGYFPKPEKSGFSLERFSFMDSNTNTKRKKWFRPSDVVVGADGAIYVCDWFDPGVGGHMMRDNTGTGTIYRVAPKGFKPLNPKVDTGSVEGMINALKSPAVNVRALGFIALKEAGAKAVPALKALLTDENPYFRARAVWLLSQIKEGVTEVEKLLSDDDQQMRVLAYRALRRVDHNFWEMSRKLAKDKNSAVRREVALAMRNKSLEESKDILIEIAEQYDGEDRWYLEAFGTGCAKKEKEIYAMLRRKIGTPALKWENKFADIAWRLHSPEALMDFRTRAKTEALPIDVRKKALTAIAFINTKEAALVMLDIALTGPEDTKELGAWWIKNKHNSDWREYGLLEKLKKNEAPQEVFDLSKYLSKDNGNLPSIQKLLTMKGDKANGEKIFHSRGACFSCHKIDNKGRQLGPDLTGIGKKFEASILLDSMINPSSAIAFGFEGTTVKTKDGKILTGFVISDSDPLILKDLAGSQISVDLKDISQRNNMKESLMPSVKNLGFSAQDVVDVLEYLKNN